MYLLRLKDCRHCTHKHTILSASPFFIFGESFSHSLMSCVLVLPSHDQHDYFMYRLFIFFMAPLNHTGEKSKTIAPFLPVIKFNTLSISYQHTRIRPTERRTKKNPITNLFTWFVLRALSLFFFIFTHSPLSAWAPIPIFINITFTISMFNIYRMLRMTISQDFFFRWFWARCQQTLGVFNRRCGRKRSLCFFLPFLVQHASLKRIAE